MNPTCGVLDPTNDRGAGGSSHDLCSLGFTKARRLETVFFSNPFLRVEVALRHGNMCSTSRHLNKNPDMLYAIDHNTSLEDNLTLGVEIVGALRAMVQTGIVSVPALVAWCAVCRPFRTFSRFFFVFQEWVTSHHGLQSFRGGSHIVLPPSGHKIHIAVSA